MGKHKLGFVAFDSAKRRLPKRLLDTIESWLDGRSSRVCLPGSIPARRSNCSCTMREVQCPPGLWSPPKKCPCLHGP
jgi:hypothetical protein